MDLTPLTAVLAVLSGAKIRPAAGVFGGGGSVRATPLLLYGVGIGDTHVATGASAAAAWKATAG